jgi:hexosaminidase
MKNQNHRSPFIFIVSAMLLCGSIFVSAQTGSKPFTVPELTEWTPASGTMTPAGRIVVRSKALQTVARQMAADYELMFQKPLTVTTGKAHDGDIVLSQVKNPALGQEGYTLNVGRTAEVSAATATGAYWATRTLLQMLERQKAIPCGRSTDVPQYKLRGFMLDVGRKYVPMNYLRNLVRIMSYYKMNTLQLHLNDNAFKQYFDNDWQKTPAAFRLECDTYPGLTAKDGSYSKKEFIALQELADSLHVEIVPEIDVPAHCLALTHYKPEIGSQKYGMDHLDLGKKETYDFVDALFKEYLAGKKPVFRGRRVNIGTDEYSNADPQVVEQFRAFADHYLALVESYGKQPMMWGSLSHAAGKTPVRSKGVLMNMWYNGYAQPKDMKAQGYHMVSIPDGFVYIVPAAGYYYDYLNCEWLYNSWTPAQIGGVKFEEQDPSVEGGMFAVWNDHFGNGISTKDINDRVYPAMQTLSTKCWTGQKTSLPYATFDKERLGLSEAPGVNERGLLRTESVTLDEVKPGTPLNLPLKESGYGQSVSFDIDCAPEQKGTVLTQSEYATFYLSDPQSGKLGFKRDGYLNTFNYRLPQTGHVSLRIESTNKETRLFVNGQRRDVLNTQQVFVFNPESKLQTMPEAPLTPDVYVPGAKMNYVRTLVFPLAEAGRFSSKVTRLQVEKIK